MSRTKTTTTDSSSTAKMFGGRVPENLVDAIKILAIEQKKTAAAILLEALQDILVKYGKKKVPIE